MVIFLKITVFIFVIVLAFYMLRLFMYVKNKWELKTYAFFVQIIGLALIGIATFLDVLNYYYDTAIFINIYFTLGSIIYIIGVILWSNYTKKMIDIFAERASTDYMTGVLNRDGLEKIFNNSVRENKCFYIIVCDLDGTKRINDSKGHLCGDGYITSTTKTIKDTIGTNGYIARTGGDEFVILLKYIDAEELEKIIITVKRLVSKFLPEQGTRISIGYSVFPDDGISFETLIKIADDKMYEDKKSGKLNRG